MIRKIIILVFACINLPLGLINAQIKNDSIDLDQMLGPSFENNVDSGYNPSKDNIKIRKLSSGLEAGTSFFYSPHNFYGPSFYIAPTLNYYITPRFNLQTGVVLERSIFYPLNESDNNLNRSIASMNISLFARGSYLLTPRLRVHGTVFQTVNDVPSQLKYSSPLSYNSQGAIIGLDYKITNCLSIGLGVRMQNNSYNLLNEGYFYPDMGY